MAMQIDVVNIEGQKVGQVEIAALLGRRAMIRDT
jgi:hypothetical protein